MNEIRFECTGCGACCTGSPGYVWVTGDEIAAMAQFLKIDVPLFMRRYIRKVGQRLSLIEMKNYDCVFLKDKKCQLYQVRPKQCRTFPFWPGLNWEEAAKSCEGIGRGPVLSKEEIEAIVF